MVTRAQCGNEGTKEAMELSEERERSRPQPERREREIERREQEAPQPSRRFGGDEPRPSGPPSTPSDPDQEFV